MRLSQPITQGGQTFLHRMRMWMQILRTAFFFSTISAFLTFTALCFYNFTEKNLDEYINFLFVKIGIGNTASSLKTIQTINSKLIFLLYISLSLGSSVGLFLFIFWQRQGINTQNKQTISGISCLPEKQIIRKINRKQLAGPIYLMNLPIVKGTEKQHILISNGSGVNLPL